MISIRGATTAEENTAASILEATGEMLQEIIASNNLKLDHIIDITFSATKDLNAVYPAVAARDMGITEAGLFCVQEMDVPGSLPMCIRLLLHAEAQNKLQSEAHHIYLKNATHLRPDLTTPKKPMSGVKGTSPFSIAIDGPSGAGKSTVAKEVAKTAGIIYIDTGAMYRAVALYYIQKGISPTDAAAVEAGLDDISIDIVHDADKHQRLILNGTDVTEALRTQQVAEGSSIVAAYQAVRQKLTSLQRSLAHKHSVVMDGRDIGTFVLPNADIKIYLDASLEERINRRIGELRAKGEPTDYEIIKREIEIRDNRDINREHAPLSKAPDAVYLKTDGLSVAEIVEIIIKNFQI